MICPALVARSEREVVAKLTAPNGHAWQARARRLDCRQLASPPNCVGSQAVCRDNIWDRPSRRRCPAVCIKDIAQPVKVSGRLEVQVSDSTSALAFPRQAVGGVVAPGDHDSRL